MLEVSESKFKSLKNDRYIVYTSQPLTEGCECFSTRSNIKTNHYFVSAVKANNIYQLHGKYYFTNEDLSIAADWFPKHCLPIIGAFKKAKLSKSCIVDVSGLSAFKGIETNEDVSIFEWHLYITLFNDFTVKQCRTERAKLYDATYNASKYDLLSKIQNSDFLKSKDFKIINVRREKQELVPIALIIKDAIDLTYGIVYIDMYNKLSIIWK